MTMSEHPFPEVKCPWCGEGSYADPDILGAHMMKDCPNKPQVIRTGPWSRIQQKWNEADANLGTDVDVGEIVVCDICNADYTDSDRVGGFQFETKAVCPECEPDYLKDVAKYHEERYIRAKAFPGETFRHFVMRLRGSVNTIRIDILSDRGFKR